ncbi:MAG: hypothetical protein M1828_005016 [Chrysothrix sp. TS-e1954]|nr:MAG: hypothetical protein M1828_005016 [Chrysothrix sp. TS-e1954]
MDPLSVTASLIGIVEAALRTTSALVKYTKDTKNASTDRTMLAEETLLLSKLLQRLRDRAQASQHEESWLTDHQEIVRQFEASYDDLATALKYDASTGKLRAESKSKALRSIAKWSFSKSEVYAILERITRLQQHANALLVDDQYALLERIDQKQEEAHNQQLRTSILSWLSPLPMTQIHQTFSDQAEKGSGKWFLADPTFQDWKNGNKKRLWCCGIPGAGKTVMASIVVNYLRQDRPENPKGRIGVSFVYLKYNETDQTLDNVLSSLLKQLLHDVDDIHPRVSGLYEQHRDRNTSLTSEEIFETLLTIIESHEEVFCVIDALDECSEELRWELVEKLEDLGPKLRVLITSRILDSIAEELEAYARVEIRANKADIELFIEHQIRRNRNLRKIVDRSPSLREDIKVGVYNTAQDMFLLARLHVESLASAAGLSVKHVRNKLQTLPTTLKGTYDDAMQRIENQEPDHKRIALKAMAWVCYAFRALSLKELQHAIAVEPRDKVLDEDLVMDGQSITSLCAGLVVVDQRTNIVNLVHYSAKSYFDESRHVQFPEFHAKITLICATYLTLDSLKGARIWEMVQDYPLACYAAQFMGDHARNSPEESLEPAILDVICNLLSHPDKRKPLLSLLDGLDLIQAGFYSKGKPRTLVNAEDLANADTETELPAALENVLQLEQADSLSTMSSNVTCGSEADTLMGDHARDEELWTTKIRTSSIPEVTALHLAASMGLAKIASLLLKETTNIDAVDETGKTALALALERGFEKAVELLLDSGACVDLRQEHGRNVLLLITERGWFTAGNTIARKARITVEAEVPGRPQDRIRFLLASYDNNIEDMSRIAARDELKLGSIDHDIGGAALFLAVEIGSIEMVEALLPLGLNVDSKDELGQTALHRATRRKYDRMIRLLLKHGANIECKDDDHRTPWSANLRCSSPETLQILLDAGANPSTCGQQGVSKLYTAAKDGNAAIVEYMLKSGTDPSIQTQYGWAPLHWAASYGHENCVKLLLAAGADTDVVSDQRVTPLDLATQADQSVIAELLRKAGAKLYQDTTIAAGHRELESKEDGNWTLVNAPDSEATAAGMDEGKRHMGSDKLRLVYDKPLTRTLLNPAAVGRFVYPSGTSGAIDHSYEVSHFLESSTNVLSVRRSKKRAEMWEYAGLQKSYDNESTLYDGTNTKDSYQEFVLTGGQQDPLAKRLTMHKDWTGGWKVRRDDLEDSATKAYLLRTTPEWSTSKEEDSRWMMDDGLLQARSGWDDATPWLCIEKGVGLQMQDLIVACWVFKLWSETAALQRHGS